MRSFILFVYAITVIAAGCGKQKKTGQPIIEDTSEPKLGQENVIVQPMSDDTSLVGSGDLDNIVAYMKANSYTILEFNTIGDSVVYTGGNLQEAVHSDPKLIAYNDPKLVFALEGKAIKLIGSNPPKEYDVSKGRLWVHLAGGNRVGVYHDVN